MARNGEKVHIYIGGNAIPGKIKGEPWTDKVTLASGRTIPTLIAMVTTLRERNPEGPNAGETFYAQTPENLAFTTMRDDYVVGLDVTEDGHILNSMDLDRLVGLSISARQKARADAAAPVEVDLDLSDALGEVIPAAD